MQVNWGPFDCTFPMIIDCFYECRQRRLKLDPFGSFHIPNVMIQAITVHELLESSLSQSILLLPSLTSTFSFGTVRDWRKIRKWAQFSYFGNSFFCESSGIGSSLAVWTHSKRKKWIMKKSDSEENRKRNFPLTLYGKISNKNLQHCMLLYAAT